MTDLREHWGDTLRTIACLGVIMIHTVSPIVTDFEQSERVVWTISNLINSTLRFCVPIFLMLTGAFVLPKEMPYLTFLKKRLDKILLPFLFWSLVYIAYEIIRKWSPEEVKDIRKVGQHVISEVFHGASFHFWYIYVIIGIYLFIPIIGAWARRAEFKELYIFLGIWYIISFGNFPPFDRIDSELDLTNFSGYLGFLILGFTLSRLPVNRSQWPIFLLMMIAGSLITTIASHWLTLSKGAFLDTYYFYLTPNVILASAGMFMLLRHRNIQWTPWNRFAAVIGKHSYGIYLAHILFLSILSKIGINWRMSHPAIGIAVTFILASLLSLITVKAIARLPFGSKISG
jgi:surface polysaccharide O-acyltransferase-like enzyme